MNYSWKTFGIKLALYFVIGYAMLGVIEPSPILYLIIFSIASAVTNFFMGDIYVYNQYGSIIAAILEGFMAGLTLYIMNMVLTEANFQSSTLIGAGVITAIVEYFLHMFFARDRI